MFEIINAVVAIAVVYLLFSNNRLKVRLGELDAAFRGLQSRGAGVETPPKTSEPAPGKPKKQEARAAQYDPWAKAKGKKSAPTTVRPEGEHKKPDPVAPRPKPFVFKEENWVAARKWLVENWFLAVAAVSLALAGVFLVQYGVENGVLSPFWRVMAAAALGVALIGGGEFVRRRWGDGDASHTAYLPSTFAGAGIIALFAAVLSARQMYGLIGAEAALIYLIMVSVVAIGLGWFYGPYLAVVGILGSTAAPFLVGGSSDATELFFYYFALIGVAALLVDAMKRWAWVSALGLIFAYVAAGLIYGDGAAGEHFLAFGLITSVAAIALPRLSIWPSHDGAMAGLGVSAVLRVFNKGKTGGAGSKFPTRVAAGAVAGAGAIAMAVAVTDAGAAEVWLAIITLCILYLLIVLWCRRAPALDNLALIPALLFGAVIFVQYLDWGSLFELFAQGAQRPPETAPPSTVSVFAGLALIGSALAFWRSLWPQGRGQPWAVGAAIFAPFIFVMLEIFWDPRDVLGAGRWAGHAIMIAAVMVFFAERVARRDGDDKRRVAYFALAALTMITYGLVVMLSSAALTVALAVMVLGAAMIDRRLNLPLIGFFVQVGVIVIGWRLVFMPGIDWASRAPIWEVLLAYLGSAALLGAAWVVLGKRQRTGPRITVESGVWSIIGVLGSVLLGRALGRGFDDHWGVSLLASVWMMLMLVQLYRLRAGGALRWVRIVLASVYGLVAGVGYGLLFTFMHPVIGLYGRVIGPPVFNSLMVAFVIPALIFGVGVWKLPDLNRPLRLGFIALSAIFAANYVGLEIRHLWRGDNLMVDGTSAPELYSYTIALLLGSVGLLFLAFNRRSTTLRRIATIGVALTIAKVFLIDMSGLTGLLRVASFLGLGLSLAALGWLYRRMQAQWDRDAPEK